MDLTTGEAVKALGVSADTLRRWDRDMLKQLDLVEGAEAVVVRATSVLIEPAHA